MKHSKRILHTLVLVSLVMVSLLASYTPAHAAAIPVNTPDDENGENLSKCSLREAIISANEGIAFGGCVQGTKNAPDSIFLPTFTRNYALSKYGSGEDAGKIGDLDILEPITITGDRAKWPTISGASGNDRVFHILTNGQVSIQNLVITGGFYVEKGGGIYLDTRIRNQVPTYTPTLTLMYVRLWDNKSQKSGGGITIDAGATANIFYSTIEHNISAAAGGIQNEGSLYLESSLVIDNSYTGISANSIFDNQNTRIYNTTITENDSIGLIGAGISVARYSTLEMINVTMVNNSGIGLELKGEANGFIANSIIARQLDNYPDCAFAGTNYFGSAGSNLISDATCMFAAGGDMIREDHLIGVAPSLAANGGPTRTFALADDGPAVDAGNNATCRLSDQRLRRRPAVGISGSAICDIGAYEVNGEEFIRTYLPITRR